MRLIDADNLKWNLCIKFGNRLPDGLLEEIDNTPTVNKCDNCDLMFKEKTKKEEKDDSQKSD